MKRKNEGALLQTFHDLKYSLRYENLSVYDLPESQLGAIRALKPVIPELVDQAKIKDQDVPSSKYRFFIPLTLEDKVSITMFTLIFEDIKALNRAACSEDCFDFKHMEHFGKLGQSCSVRDLPQISSVQEELENTAFVAITGTDGSVIYYRVGDGIVKPDDARVD